MPTKSTLRRLVDEALDDITLTEFVEKRRENGKSVREITGELNSVTGIPIGWRTLYRWLERTDVAS